MSRLRLPLLAVFVLAVVLPSVAFGQNDITFQVNMRVQVLEDAFTYSTDSVVVRGDFNSWGGNAQMLTDADGDSIYVGIFNVGTGTGIAYKYVTRRAGADGWESIADNRTLTLTGSPQTIPVVYFNDDSVVSPSDDITFQVNMRIKVLEGVFGAPGDKVVVRGSFNGWGGNSQECTDADGDSVYAGTFTVFGSPNDEVQYKFVMVTSAGDAWEDRLPSNRKFTLTGSPLTLAVVHFDDDQVVSLPVSGNLLWQVDMSAFEELGWFRRAEGDSMHIRGGFNGWTSSDPALSWMDRLPGTETYQLITAYDGFSGDDLPHKFFMNMNDAAAATRFPGFSTNTDGIQYEHPAERGDGNRLYTLPSGGGNVEAALFYFSDINPSGLVPQGKTITVTFQVNMAAALSYTDPFVPASDSLLLLLEDPIWRTATGLATPSSSTSGIQLTDPNSDGIWTADLTFSGPTHYNIQYRYRYKHTDGTQVDEGGGLGAQKPYRSRFVGPNGPRDFPNAWTFPVDTWKKDPPLEAETAPFSTVVSVERLDDLGLPLRYSLEQNYPNPFNPSTVIRYSIPVQGQVGLKLFNILGQEVMTLLNLKQDAGTYEVGLNGSNLPSGVYFYRLEAGTFVEAKKMMLIK